MIDAIEAGEIPTERGLTRDELEMFRRGAMENMFFVGFTAPAVAWAKDAVENGRDTTLAGRLLEIMDSCCQCAFSVMEACGHPAVCSRGCYYCCTHLAVCSLPHEAVAIADHILSTYSPEEMDRLEREIDEYEARTVGLTFSEWNEIPVRCPLLVDGCCSVYDVRPGVCRKYHSGSVDMCRKAAADPTGDWAQLQNPRTNEATSYAQTGIMCLLRKLGIPNDELDMLRAVRLVLSDPSLITSWWRRPNAFDGVAVYTIHPDRLARQRDISLKRIVCAAIDALPIWPKPDRSHRPPAPADRKKKRNRKLAHAR